MHPFFKFFNSDKPHIPNDSSEWPEEWTRIEYKTYPRFQQIQLPEPSLGGANLERAILERKSERDFSEKPMSLNELSALLFYGGGVTKRGENQNLWRRMYPSGGSRYPVEIYVIGSRVDGLGSGAYHYNVKDHALEFLADCDKEEARKFFYYDFVKDAAAVFFFSAFPMRSGAKYGNLGFKYPLIEAGHIAQNMYLTSAALRLKCCALGGLNEEAAHRLLRIDGQNETVFYALAVGV